MWNKHLAQGTLSDLVNEIMPFVTSQRVQISLKGEQKKKRVESTVNCQVIFSQINIRPKSSCFSVNNHM